ncbi:hypothetical protein GCM10027258_23740 [Amycolatopsis stemonae]
MDTLVLRQHTETACRRSGVLSLRRRDLNEEDCTIWLREKGRAREQPVSPTLLAALIEHFDIRNRFGEPDDLIFRYAGGRPIGNNYYQGRWQRLRRHVDWADRLGVSAHWLRYTTLTWAERNFGYATATAYAGHAPGGKRSGNTLTYVTPTMEELATALAILVGEPHPLAAVGHQLGDDGDFALPVREPRALLPVDDEVRWRAELERYLVSGPVATGGKTTTSDPVDAVRRVRHQLEQAERYGMRRPSQRTPTVATGLPKEVVQDAVNTIKLTLADGHGVVDAGFVSSMLAGDIMTAAAEVDAVALVRSHLEHAVRTALERIKEEVAATASPIHRQGHASTRAVPGDRQISSPPGDRQPASRAGDRPSSASPRQPAQRTSSPTASPPQALATPPPHAQVTAPDGAQLDSRPTSPKTGARAGGTAVSWLGFAFGSVTSIAANVLHTWLPASSQPPGWTPGLGPQLGAGVWPITLIVTVEVLARNLGRPRRRPHHHRPIRPAWLDSLDIDQRLQPLFVCRAWQSHVRTPESVNRSIVPSS